jgi:ankyrin repeat protein
MFPNPQDALPFPKKPNLEQYKKLAKELVRAAKKDDDALIQWSSQWVSLLMRRSGVEITKNLPVRTDRWIRQVANFAKRELVAAKKSATLTKAQFVIARAEGFESWPKFAQYIDKVANSSSAVAQFEESADAIVTGDIAKLKRLLRDNPKLVRAKSSREHGATLLHYAAANGVEGYRQKTPKNIVEITNVLLDAGADVNATCDVYGGDCTTLGLAATSVHPENAGVMNDLLGVLLDRGASIDQHNSAGNDQDIVFACLANGRLGAARFLVERGAKLDFVSAAALDRLDIVQQQFNPDGTRKKSLSKELMQEAFRYACGYGGTRVVEFLLERGADLAEHSGDGQTGTHYACIFGRLDTLKVLLKHNPPLEATNQYGGTVLGQSLWSAAHGGDPEVYSQIIETLIAAGAKVPDRHVPVNPTIDKLLEKYGSHPEPNWWWYGEEPVEKRSR